jgi:hypothetical protein
MVALSLSLFLFRESASLPLRAKKATTKSAEGVSPSGVLGSNAVTFFLSLSSKANTRARFFVSLYEVRWKTKNAVSLSLLPLVRRARAGVHFPPKKSGFDFFGKRSTWLPLDSVESRCNPKRAAKTLNIFFFVVGPVFSSCFDTSRERKKKVVVGGVGGVVSETFIKERERERERENE